jgi:hypothetical protein
MRPLLSRPYHLHTSARHHARVALYFGGFVFLFLLIFKPFGLLHLGERLPMLAMGYGAVCTGVMLLLNVGVPRLLPHWFSDAGWTVGRELIWSAVNVALIGLGNALYTAGIGLAPWSFATIGNFTLFTIAVGLFPIALSVVLNEARLYREYARRSAGINKELEQREEAPDPPPTTADRIRIPTEGNAEDLELDAEALCFIRSADNYIEVHHRSGRAVERTVLRGSLKAVEEALAGNDRFLRCHKSHLADLRKVQRVSGNAQGLKLHLDGIEEPVPVSRQLTSLVRARLAVRP